MNRKIFQKCLLITLIGIGSCNTQQKNSSDEYSVFRGGSNHAAVYPSASIDDIPKIKWKFKTGGAVHSSVAINDGKIFFGSGDSTFYCLTENSGELTWKYKTGGGIYSSPAVDGQLVYFGSYDGDFYALNKDDGTIKWKFQTEGEKRFEAKGIHGRQPKDSLMQDDWDFFLSSPVLNNETVYFGTGSGNFYALNKKDGKLKWKFKTGGVIHASPAIAFGNVYFGSWDTYMYALNAENGTELWKFKTGEDSLYHNQTGMQGSPMVADSILYFGCRDSHLYAVNAFTGQLKWKRFNDYSWVSSCPVIFKDKLIYTTSDRRSLIALNKVNGDSIYEAKGKGMMISSPSIAGNSVFCGDLNGFITNYDVNTGHYISRFHVAQPLSDKFRILNNDSTLNEEFVFSKEKRDKEKMTSLEMIFTLGSIISSPVIKNKTIYIGSGNGYFYALN